MMRVNKGKYISYCIILFVLVGIISTNVIGKKQDEVYKQDYYQHQKAIELLGKGQFEQGVKILKDLIIKYPDEFELYYKVGLVYSEKKDYENAAIYYQKAIDIRPALLKDTTFTFRMGESLYNINQFEIAKQYLLLPVPEQFQIQKDELLKLIENKIQS